MAYNFKSEYHVNWRATVGRELLHQGGWDGGAALCGEAQCAVRPTYDWVFLSRSLAPEVLLY